MVKIKIRVSISQCEADNNSYYLVIVEICARAQANGASPCKWPKDKWETAACDTTTSDSRVATSILPVSDDQ